MSIEAPDVVALAESDSYLKWAAWLLEPTDWHAELAVLRSDITPSDRQRVDAIASTRFEDAVGEYDVRTLRARLRRQPPDVLLLACTGPTIAFLTSVVVPRSARSAIIVAGLPGVGLPVRDRAIRARSGIDVFVAHSIREQGEYRAAFDRHAADGAPPPAVALASLPFVSPSRGSNGIAAPASKRVVFAAQPSVPSSAAQRRTLLERLAALGPPAPIVKLRRRSSEAVTHHEPHPYDEIWNQMVAQNVFDGDALEFSDASLSQVLDQAGCLVTVSSTAAIEAIGRGCPVVVADDFGVSDELLNDVFTGSGLIGSLDRATVAAAGPPRREWMADNYFHDPALDDWGQVVGRLVSRAPPRRRRVEWRTFVSRTVAARSARLIRATLRGFR